MSHFLVWGFFVVFGFLKRDFSFILTASKIQEYGFEKGIILISPQIIAE